MLSPIDHYQNAVANITDDDERLAFMLKYAFIVGEYEEEAAKPIKKKHIKGTKWSGLKIDDYEKLDTIADKYYSLVGVTQAQKREYMSRKNSQITTNLSAIRIDPSTPVIYEDTNCCDKPDIVMLSDYAVCASCARKVEGSDEYSANFAEASIAPSKTMVMGNAYIEPENIDPTNSLAQQAKNNSDDTVTDKDIARNVASTKEKGKLLADPLLRLQGIRVSPFTQKEWERIYKAVVNGIENHKDISFEHVNRTVHRLKMQKFYKDPYIIWEKITGTKLKAIPDGALWAIQHIITPQLTIMGHSSSETDRIAAASLLYKSLQLCEEKEFMDMIIMLKGEAHLTKLDNIWQASCKRGNWKYYPN